jgi:hypothetical protein
MPGPSFASTLQASAVQNWNGSWITLGQNDSATIPQTPNGTVILVAANVSTLNNQGELTLSSGGSMPTAVTVPALSSQPTVVIQNWRANNLTVTNTSRAANTPIMIALCGPGMPGSFPVALPATNTAVVLGTLQSAQGTTLPQFMQLITESNAPTLGVVGIIGGPLDATGNNGYVIAVNAGSSTGPPSPAPAPAGYFATTTTNAYVFPVNNWGSSQVYAVNLSPATAQVLTVRLRAL